MKIYYEFTTSRGQVWRVPVLIIAADRAKYFAKDYGGDMDKSMNEDTIPLFNRHPDEIEDWARNNMDWADVKDCAALIDDCQSVDMQGQWVNPVRTRVGDS
jgi:hypothetical protein